MKKVTRVSQIRFPTIKSPNKSISYAVSARPRNSLPQDLQEQENERVQIQELQHWTARYHQASKKTKSKLIKSLYRTPSKKGTKVLEYHQSSQLAEAKVFLLRLESQLKKVDDINYSSMYKNLEYCSGVYENFYGDLLKELQKITSALTLRYQELQECIEKKRSDHIKSMETMQSYKMRISVVRESIEGKELELEPIKITIDRLERARVTILKHCLNVGYDVREEGLIWILRKLGFAPDQDDFPAFMTEKEINYIILKFQIQQKSKQKDQILDIDENGRTFGKTSDEICQIVARKKKRELSMVREGQVFNHLKQIHNLNYRTQKHKYIDEDVLKMAEECFPKTKHTKYEIIYKQTSKKLNKYCVNQIYKKNSWKTKDVAESRRQSLNTLKILSHFEAKIEDYLRKANSQKALQSDEERQLDQIVRSLRYESYQEPSKVERKSRNAVSVLCCLVGHRKAKRIVEQELSHLL